MRARVWVGGAFDRQACRLVGTPTMVRTQLQKSAYVMRCLPDLSPLDLSGYIVGGASA